MLTLTFNIKYSKTMYLGIDLGTSGVKVIILNGTGELQAQASSPLSVSRPKPLWSEQDPNHWWQATNNAMSQLKSQHGNVLSQVVAIGLSGQMHGATLLDKHNQIIRPAILWNDGRCSAECRELERREPESRDITGNIAMPGFTAPKLVWLKKYEADNFAKIAKVLLPKDYLRLLMTGEFASDMSDSAGTLWLDVKKRCWSAKMLAATDMREDQMPKLYEGTQVTGHLLADVAESWGLGQVPVVAGGGDNAAGAAGIGVIKPNEAFLSLGTSGVYFVANAKFQPNPQGSVHAFCHCIPDTWHQMSVILSAASCLSWVTELTGAKDEAQLLAEVAELDFSSPCQVTFLPYLSGERTPHNNPNAKGVFFGLGLSTDRAELARAVLEGVAFAFADGQAALKEAGTVIEQVSVIGGGARSALWGKILASILNAPLTYRDGGEVGPAYGAARLAQIGTSKATPADICSPGKIKHIITPDKQMQSYYTKQYQHYKALYQAVKSHF